MSDIETMWLVIAGLLGLAIIAFVIYLIASTARNRPGSGGRHRATPKNRPHRDTFRTEEPEPEPLKRAAIIIEGADDSLRTALVAQCRDAGWDEPLWLEVLDGAGAQTAATEALRDNVDVACVRGGAGVARSVAGVFAGTETPVSFLPAPTGHEGAYDDEAAAHTPSAGPSTWPTSVGTGPDPAVAAALTVALTGKNARIDIGRVRLGPETPPTADADNPAPSPRTAVFLHSLVIGEVIANDEPALRTKDVARGIVSANPFTAAVKPDDEEAVIRPSRSISFATSDQPLIDGEEETRVLDAHLYASRSLKGWTGVAKAMMRKSSRATPLLVPLRSAAFTVTLDKTAPVTVDGERVDLDWPIGETTVWVDPRALVVRR